MNTKKTLLTLSTILLFTFSLLTGCATPLETSIPIVIEDAKEESLVVTLPKDENTADSIEKPTEELEEPNVDESPIEKGESSSSKPPISGTLTVEFLDVGQGDSSLIITPKGHTLLIDAGNRGDYPLIASRLEAYSVKTIDILIATHPHADHIGSMEDVVKNIPIGKIYMPDATTTTKTFEGLLMAIDQKGYGVSIAKAGVHIDLEENLALKFVSPIGHESDLNNSSAVLHLTYGESSFLFTGDMEQEAEQKIRENIDVDVLKVGHHGSNTSSSHDFLKKVTPEISIISVGKDNKYEHPHMDALSRLATYSKAIYRTDESGSVVVKTDGLTYDIKGIKTTVTQQSPVKEAPVTVSPPKKTTPSVSEVIPEESPQVDTQTKQVFITKTGKKYHADGCRSLSKSKIPISKEDAMKKGLSPCGICKP